MFIDKIQKYLSDAIIALVGLAYTNLLGFVLSFSVGFICTLDADYEKLSLKLIMYILFLILILPILVIIFYLLLNQLFNQTKHKKRCIIILGFSYGFIFLLRLKLKLTDAKFHSFDYLIGTGILVSVYILLYFMALQESKSKKNLDNS